MSAGNSAGQSPFRRDPLGTNFNQPTFTRMKPDQWYLLAITALCLTLGALEFAYYSTPPKGAFVFLPKR